MLKIYILFVFLACAGCQTVQNPLSEKICSRIDTVTLTVTRPEKDPSSNYSVKAVWRRSETKPTESGTKASECILESPVTTGRLNQWMHIGTGTAPKEVTFKTQFLIDGEMVDIDSYPGLHFKVIIIPQEDGRVQVKGILLASQTVDEKVEFISVPFNVTGLLDEPKIIYQENVVFNPLH